MTLPIEADNPYLAGNYAPVAGEMSCDGMKVVGEIPSDLHGVYVRNGPNPRFAPNGRYHWFDGDGMLHAAHFEGGELRYRNKWVRTAAFDAETAAGAPLWRGIREPVIDNPPGAPLKDTANTDVVFHNGKLLALWYLAGKPYRVDARTLETRGPEDFGGLLRNRVSAHAKVDRHTGELMFFDYATRPPYMTYGVVSAAGALSHVTAIELPGPRLPHDMAITEHHSILLDLPWFPDAEALRNGRHKIGFHPDVPSRFGILRRHADGARIRWFEAAPCYIYHTINAWEDGDEITLVGCRVANPDPPDGLTSEAQRWLAYVRLEAKLYRWRFNLRTGAVTEGPLDDANNEFPTINQAYLGRRSRYCYNVSIAPAPTLLFDGLVKYDTDTGKSESLSFGPGRYGSEAPFAPRPNPRSEDDGYVVSFVHDENEGSSEVWIIDALRFDSGPVAKVRLPQRVPLGFHACWVPGGDLPAPSPLQSLRASS